jgi:hypothetical protein
MTRIVNDERNTTALVEKYIGTAYDQMSALYAQLDELTTLYDELASWQGLSATPPTLRKDGVSALEEGDRYYNTTTNALYIYVSSAWVNANASTTNTEVVTVTAPMISGSQTLIDLAVAYDSGAGTVLVFVNGVFQISQVSNPGGYNYLETSDTRITIDDILEVNDLVAVVTNVPVAIP